MTPPSPKKEFMEMAKDIRKHACCCDDPLPDAYIAQILQVIDAKAREEQKEKDAKIATEMWLETRDNVHWYSGSVQEEIRSRRPKPKKEENRE